MRYETATLLLQSVTLGNVFSNDVCGKKRKNRLNEQEHISLNKG